MVKVISAYSFKKQNTYSIVGDVVTTCLIGSTRLAVAHRNHLIEIITLRNCESDSETAIDLNENSQRSKISFPTIDQVELMYYCVTGNYILTLERKLVEYNPDHSLVGLSSTICSAARQQTFVRVYTNFDVASDSTDHCFSIPIRARIASKTTPNISSNDYIEVIEIPIADGQDNNSKDSANLISPHLIACCQMSGSIAVCLNQEIRFYELRKCINDFNKLHFIDFFQTQFSVRLEFRPCKMTLVENVIACLDSETAVAFKIVDLNDVGTEDGTTSNSIETAVNNFDSFLDSSANCQKPNENSYSRYNQNSGGSYRRNMSVDFEVAKHCNQANGINFQTDLRSTWDHENDRRRSVFSEDRPCLVNDSKIILKNFETNYSQQQHQQGGRKFFSIRSLVQLRLPHNSRSNGKRVEDSSRGPKTASTTTQAIHDEFRCLALKGIYCKAHRSNQQEQRAEFIDKNPSTHSLKSSYNENCVGFSLFLTTVSDGYMYQFTNQGKWYSENSKCLAIYPFTAPVIDIVINDFVIHAVTECGIETFSSRIGHKLFSSYFEYPMMSDPYPEETSPLVDAPICVIGICGFFGIRFVTASANNLVLLTTDSESVRKNTSTQLSRSSSQFRNNTSQTAIVGGPPKTTAVSNSYSIGSSPNREWTIYDLKLPKPETLVDDIENLATIYEQTSPEIYFELMEEAHVIIRLARILMDVASGSWNIRDEIVPNDDLEKCYRKTCKILADFTIHSSRKEVYSQAVAYYAMCKHSIPELYGNCINSGQQNVDGLIYTLKMVLSQIGSSKSNAEYLNQNVPRRICNNWSYDPAEIENVVHYVADRSYAEEFFEFFLMHASRDLAQIGLSSSIFRENLNQRFFTLYSENDQQKLSTEEKFCFILCLCYRGEYAEALRTFEMLTRSQVFIVLRDYWSHLLFDNLQPDNYRKCSFSDLTESILFVTSSDHLIEATADAIIRILIVTHDIDLDCLLKLFMNYFALHVGQPGYRTSQRVFEIVLQSYFYDFFYYGMRNAMTLGGQIESVYGGDGLTTTTIGKLTVETDTVSAEWLRPLLMPSGRAIGKDDCPAAEQLPNEKRQNSINLSEDSSTGTTVDSNYEDPEFEALKILFRMYLGLLRQFTAEQVVSDDTVNLDDQTTILSNSQSFRLAIIDYMHHNTSEIKSVHAKYDTNSLTNGPLMSILPDYDAIVAAAAAPQSTNDEGKYWQARNFRRPIVFFERREMFLNEMPPLNYPGCFKEDFDGVRYFNGSNKPVNLLLIKIQALLSSGKLGSSLINDFIAFAHTYPNVIGIDSLLTILLPKSEAIEFLIHTIPQHVLDYAKVRLTSCNQWQILFQRILAKKNEINTELEANASGIYDTVIHDILRYLVDSKSLDIFLDCIPEQQISRLDYNMEKADNGQFETDKYRTQSQDGVDETNPFELIMREALVKQRSDALSAMIQSSGRQLNDAVNSFQLNFN